VTDRHDLGDAKQQHQNQPGQPSKAGDSPPTSKGVPHRAVHNEGARGPGSSTQGAAPPRRSSLTRSRAVPADEIPATMPLGRRGKSRLYTAWVIGFVVSVLGSLFSYLKDWPMGATIVCLFGLTVAIVSLSVRMKYVEADAGGEHAAARELQSGEV
jgi:hypothetical protein